MRPVQQPDVFHAIAHPARRAILTLLQGGEKPASQLAQPFGVSFAAVSQHLKVLKNAHLVSEHREGRQRIYQLHAHALGEVMDWVAAFRAEWNARLDSLGTHLDKKHGRKKR